MGRDLTKFRARIVNPTGGSNSIEWQGKKQSLAEMLRILEQTHGAWGLAGVYRNFRLVGHEKSLTDEAIMLGRPSRRNAMDFLAQKGWLQAGMEVEPVPEIMPEPSGCCHQIRSILWRICRDITGRSSGLKSAILAAMATLLSAIIAALGTKIGAWIIRKLGG